MWTQIGRSGYAIRELAQMVRVGSGAVRVLATDRVEESVLKVVFMRSQRERLAREF